MSHCCRKRPGCCRRRGSCDRSRAGLKSELPAWSFTAISSDLAAAARFRHRRRYAACLGTVVITRVDATHRMDCWRPKAHHLVNSCCRFATITPSYAHVPTRSGQLPHAAIWRHDCHARAPARASGVPFGETVSDNVIVVEVMVETLDETWWRAFRATSSPVSPGRDRGARPCVGLMAAPQAPAVTPLARRRTNGACIRRAVRRAADCRSPATKPSALAAQPCETMPVRSWTISPSLSWRANSCRT